MNVCVILVHIHQPAPCEQTRKPTSARKAAQGDFSADSAHCSGDPEERTRQWGGGLPGLTSGPSQAIYTATRSSVALPGLTLSGLLRWGILAACLAEGSSPNPRA